MYEKERRKIIDAAKKMKEYRLIALCGGNVSVRLPDGNLLITPSGMEYDHMQEEDICVLNADGEIIEAKHRVSSDAAALVYIFHHMPGVNAIIHTHQPYATAIGLVEDYFPPCLVTQIDALRGGVPVAPFTPSSDIGMGELTVQYAGDKLAVILKNHGVMAYGPNLDICLTAAVYLEESAQTYLAARSTGVKITPLAEELVEREAGTMEEWLSYLQNEERGN